tara:strand:+ start:89 stop:1624 length:1536 start_codon:yes stop_codon:yes gene_type:complete
MSTNIQNIVIRYVNYLFLLIILIVTQNELLNYETIEWDIPSYLVASQDIKNFHIPNQNQWESKGPIFIYLYYLTSIISGKSFVIFKIINDLLLFTISIILYKIIHFKTNQKYLAVSSSLFFILFMSQPWAISGYSEIYSLLFLSYSYLLLLKFRYSKNVFVYIGMLFSITTLINQGTVIFLLPFLVSEYYRNNQKKFLNNSLRILFGFLIPHIIFLIIYFMSGLIDIYFATFVTIPLGYIGANYSTFYELIVFSRELFEYNLYLYISFLTLFFFIFKKFFENHSFRSKTSLTNIDILNVLCGLIFYFVGSHNYYHHLIFFIFYISISVGNIFYDKQKQIFCFFILLSVFTVFQTSFEKSYNNLRNFESIQNEYPLYNLSKVIDSNFDNDYTILALDYNLILFYLDKPNFAYIVHPSNHFEDFIIDVLSDLDKVEENYIESLINEEPDVIICNPRLIIRGEPIDLRSKKFNCEVSDYKKNYIKLDTLSYKNDENLNFYYDPYKEISVFIKQQ